jgi:hypothetical protein
LPKAEAAVEAAMEAFQQNPPRVLRYVRAALRGANGPGRVRAAGSPTTRASRECRGFVINGYYVSGAPSLFKFQQVVRLALSEAK